MTRVLHTADTHIGYRQYHSPERQADFLDAFRRVVADAVESDVDAVIHAGDLFHDRRPGLSDLLGTLEVLETLSDADIPFLAVVGNHEAKRSAQWLDLFEAMGLATRLDDHPVVVGETAFYGLDFVPRARRDDLDYEFEPHDAESAALVSHGLFEPLVPDYGNVEWDVAEILDAASVEFDAVLLGDEHVPTTQEVSDVWVTYPGSTERASAGEREERGYNLVEFEGNGDVRISRRGLETRPFVFVDLELGEHEGVERVRDRLREHDLEDAVVHVSLEGSGESVSPAGIESFATDEGALVARVKDRRELADEAVDVDVSFADPDEAVRERLREIELSDAARDLDDTIRSGAIADSNVASEVERRVEELLSDPDSFGVSHEETASGPESALASDSASDPASASDSGSASASAPDSHSDADVDADSDSDRPSDPDADSASVSSTATDGASPDPDDSSDGQSSMGEYL
jgi:DNA repair exonuclease SbcCD nuclease subunit